MPDPVTTITTAISTGKKLFDLAEATKHLELREAAVELRGQLLDLKEEIITLREQNASLQQELAQKAASRSKEERAVFRNGLRYIADAHPGENPGPYCPTCFDQSRQMISLSRMSEAFQAIGNWRCGVCRGHFQ